MRLIPCTEEAHAGAILAILNDAIVTSTALYDYKPRTPENMVAWFATKRANGFPVIGAVDENGKLLGFASYGSVPRLSGLQVHGRALGVRRQRGHRGAGLGRTLMEAIVAEAIARDVHVMVGAIDAANAGSIGLHERLGFEHSGTVRQAGFKFGRWLDVAFYQRILATPLNPVDG
jgi:L-amino acid N-acyltransferase YncA